MPMRSLTPQMRSKVAERFRALGDETRLRLLVRLYEGECNVSRLSHELGVGQASVSKHLATLRNVGFLKVRRQGAQSFYSICDDAMFDICNQMAAGVLRHHSEMNESLGLRGKKANGRTVESGV